MSRWDGYYSSSIFSLAKELAKDQRVFYIDHPYSFWEVIERWNEPNFQDKKWDVLFRRKKIQQPFAHLPNFYVFSTPLTFPINFLPNNNIYAWFAKINDFILGIGLKALFKKKKIEKYIYINSFEPFFLRTLPFTPKPLLKIYQSYDDISQESYIAKHGVRLEKEAIQNADISFATSRNLSKKLSQYGKRVFCLPNAADYEGIKNVLDIGVSDLADWPTSGPSIVYVGNFYLRVDMDLLTTLADANPAWNIVLIGPTEVVSDIEALKKSHPNLKFLGHKKFDEAVHYIQKADCTIIPFLKNELTASIYPLKINEYLSVGKPVVTTYFSEDLDDFKDVVYLSKSPAEFLENVQTALKEDNADLILKRKEYASQNTWPKRKEEFWNIILHETHLESLISS